MFDSFMQQRPQRFRPLGPYRPLQAGTPACAFILSGGGVAVLLQHNILSFLYTPEGPNRDIVALGHSAPSVQLVTQNWTTVDTPSVASHHSEPQF